MRREATGAFPRQLLCSRPTRRGFVDAQASPVGESGLKNINQRTPPRNRSAAVTKKLIAKPRPFLDEDGPAFANRTVPRLPTPCILRQSANPAKAKHPSILTELPETGAVNAHFRHYRHSARNVSGPLRRNADTNFCRPRSGIEQHGKPMGLHERKDNHLQVSEKFLNRTALTLGNLASHFL